MTKRELQDWLDQIDDEFEVTIFSHGKLMTLRGMAINYASKKMELITDATVRAR